MNYKDTKNPLNYFLLIQISACGTAKTAAPTKIESNTRRNEVIEHGKSC
jgi:hypothetical protein